MVCYFHLTDTHTILNHVMQVVNCLSVITKLLLIIFLKTECYLISSEPIFQIVFLSSVHFNADIITNKNMMGAGICDMCIERFLSIRNKVERCSRLSQ